MLGYRDDIDGLRAVAVVPVILYHAGFTRFFAGGYVGVDIFFVISGYLITSVIAAECDSGTFSLIQFYERRCRRILPALFLILFISIPFAYYWMLPEQLIEFGQTLISILALSSNFFFWWKDDGYFSKLTELNPLVHTWSLAVEEQFYFVFPLLCYFFNNKKNHLNTILICCALLSFFLAQWGDNLNLTENNEFQMFAQHSWASFYMPFGRVWELLLGTFAAFYLRVKNSARNTRNKYKTFLPLLGLILIIISVVRFDNLYIHPFPNGYTLVPTCGATLIILFGDKNTIVGRFLCTRPLRWIGLISYSVYLWHQPLLAFMRLRFNETPPFLYILIVVSAVFPLSAFSYLFIEQPFRQKKRFSRRYIFRNAFIGTLVTFILALSLIGTANKQSLHNERDDDTYLSDLKKHGSMYYTVVAYSKLQRKTTFSNDTKFENKRIALIGDSYSQDFYNIIIEGKYLTDYEIRVHYVNVECQIYIGRVDRLKFILASKKQVCTNKNDIKYGLPLIRKANIIILASSWKEWSAERLPMTIKRLNLTKQQRLIVIGGKHFGLVSKKSYATKSKEYRIKQYRHPFPWFVRVNTLLEQTIDPAIFVNVMKMICTGPNYTCPHFTPDGKLISYDNHHLTKHGALYVGKIIFNQKPLNQL